ncbi:DUF1320 family protein [bacterium]|nr:DUF1320 family protein [bacterium]
MAYCIKDDITDRAPALDNIGARLLASAIGAAEAEINLKLSPLYSVPFEPVPAIITSVAADLAASFVLAASFSGGGEAAEPVQAKFLRERAEGLLKALAEGDFSLSTDEGEPVSSARSAGFWVANLDPISNKPYWEGNLPF